MHITKVISVNYKRYTKFSQEFDDKMNILVWDNESGKSSILLGIDLVLSGSRSKVESIWLENLLNREVTEAFLGLEKKTVADLPKLIFEVYLSETWLEDLNGKNNESLIECDWLRLICEPNLEYSKELLEALKNSPENFPYEFYSISFKTFSWEGFSWYKKYLRHILIDHSNMSSEYAIREYTKDMYLSQVVTHRERAKFQNEYRKSKEDFVKWSLDSINKVLPTYNFWIRTSSKSNLETDLIIVEDWINIEHKGKWRQCFVKTEFALNKSIHETLDVVLIEEPENHLSHLNMNKLISSIQASKGWQLFIATHNSLISSRLDLRKVILLSPNEKMKWVQLKDIPTSTAAYFIKAPNHKILEYILSKKVILVEWDAEYILLEHFLSKVDKDLINNVTILTVGWTSFKRFLELWKILKIKTAVIRDNDGNHNANCIVNYSWFVVSDLIEIFFETDNLINTFEVALYQKNKDLCDKLFWTDRITLSVQDYMLKNKTTTAITLLEDGDVLAPDYISNAIEWIKK